MENSVNMFLKSESQRSPTRLQKQAPMALHLDQAPKNPFLHETRDEFATTAIPLLSPLFVSPNPPSSLSVEGEAIRFPVGLTEKKGGQHPMDNKEGWQHPAKTEHINQMALLDMFQTKFVLVDHSK